MNYKNDNALYGDIFVHLSVCMSVHDLVLLTKPYSKFSLIVIYVMRRKLWSKHEFYENWCREGHLHVQHEVLWCLESTEQLDDICVLCCRVQHFQSCLKGVEVGVMTLSLMRKSDFYKSNFSGVEIIEVLK